MARPETPTLDLGLLTFCAGVVVLAVLLTVLPPGG